MLAHTACYHLRQSWMIYPFYKSCLVIDAVHSHCSHMSVTRLHEHRELRFRSEGPAVQSRRKIGPRSSDARSAATLSQPGPWDFGFNNSSGANHLNSPVRIASVASFCGATTNARFWKFNGMLQTSLSIPKTFIHHVPLDTVPSPATRKPPKGCAPQKYNMS